MGLSFTITPDVVFQGSSYVHAPLDPNAPIDPNSANYVARLQQLITNHYGHADVMQGAAIFQATPGAPTSSVKAIIWDTGENAYPDFQSQLENVPVPADFTDAGDVDQEATIIDLDSGKIWEFWLLRKTGAQITDSSGATVDEWGAQWGGRMDTIATAPGYWVPDANGVNYGATASGIPLLAGMMTIEELQAGVVNHVIGMAIPEVLAGNWSIPAQRTDGESGDPGAIPYGAIFRFPPDLDLSTFNLTPFALMIATTIQKHGAIVWDYAGLVQFYCEPTRGQYPSGEDPYYKEGGILACPAGADPVLFPDNQEIYQCWAPAHFSNFPWDKLQMLQLQLVN